MGGEGPSTVVISDKRCFVVRHAPDGVHVAELIYLEDRIFVAAPYTVKSFRRWFQESFENEVQKIDRCHVLGAQVASDCCFVVVATVTESSSILPTVTVQTIKATEYMRWMPPAFQPDHKRASLQHIEALQLSDSLFFSEDADLTVSFPMALNPVRRALMKYSSPFAWNRGLTVPFAKAKVCWCPVVFQGVFRTLTLSSPPPSSPPLATGGGKEKGEQPPVDEQPQGQPTSSIPRSMTVLLTKRVGKGFAPCFVSAGIATDGKQLANMYECELITITPCGATLDATTNHAKADKADKADMKTPRSTFKQLRSNRGSTTNAPNAARTNYSSSYNSSIWDSGSGISQHAHQTQRTNASATGTKLDVGHVVMANSDESVFDDVAHVTLRSVVWQKACLPHLYQVLPATDPETAITSVVSRSIPNGFLEQTRKEELGVLRHDGLRGQGPSTDDDDDDGDDLFLSDLSDFESDRSSDRLDEATEAAPPNVSNTSRHQQPPYKLERGSSFSDISRSMIKQWSRTNKRRAGSMHTGRWGNMSQRTWSGDREQTAKLLFEGNIAYPTPVLTQLADAHLSNINMFTAATKVLRKDVEAKQSAGDEYSFLLRRLIGTYCAHIRDSLCLPKPVCKASPLLLPIPHGVSHGLSNTSNSNSNSNILLPEQHQGQHQQQQQQQQQADDPTGDEEGMSRSRSRNDFSGKSTRAKSSDAESTQESGIGLTDVALSVASQVLEPPRLILACLNKDSLSTIIPSRYNRLTGKNDDLFEHKEADANTQPHQQQPHQQQQQQRVSIGTRPRQPPSNQAQRSLSQEKGEASSRSVQDLQSEVHTVFQRSLERVRDVIDGVSAFSCNLLDILQDLGAEDAAARLVASLSKAYSSSQPAHTEAILDLKRLHDLTQSVEETLLFNTQDALSIFGPREQPQQPVWSHQGHASSGELPFFSGAWLTAQAAVSHAVGPGDSRDLQKSPAPASSTSKSSSNKGRSSRDMRGQHGRRRSRRSSRHRSNSRFHASATKSFEACCAMKQSQGQVLLLSSDLGLDACTHASLIFATLMTFAFQSHVPFHELLTTPQLQYTSVEACLDRSLLAFLVYAFYDDLILNARFYCPVAEPFVHLHEHWMYDCPCSDVRETRYRLATEAWLSDLQREREGVKEHESPEDGAHARQGKSRASQPTSAPDTGAKRGDLQQLQQHAAAPPSRGAPDSDQCESCCECCRRVFAADCGRHPKLNSKPSSSYATSKFAAKPSLWAAIKASFQDKASSDAKVGLARMHSQQGFSVHPPHVGSTGKVGRDRQNHGFDQSSALSSATGSSQHRSRPGSPQKSIVDDALLSTAQRKVAVPRVPLPGNVVNRHTVHVERLDAPPTRAEKGMGRKEKAPKQPTGVQPADMQQSPSPSLSSSSFGDGRNEADAGSSLQSLRMKMSVFRSADPSTAVLGSDPIVQALHLKKVYRLLVGDGQLGSGEEDTTSKRRAKEFSVWTPHNMCNCNTAMTSCSRASAVDGLDLVKRALGVGSQPQPNTPEKEGDAGKTKDTANDKPKDGNSNEASQTGASVEQSEGDDAADDPGHGPETEKARQARQRQRQRQRQIVPSQEGSSLLDDVDERLEDIQPAYETETNITGPVEDVYPRSQLVGMDFDGLGPSRPPSQASSCPRSPGPCVSSAAELGGPRTFHGAYGFLRLSDVVNLGVRDGAGFGSEGLVQVNEEKDSVDIEGAPTFGDCGHMDEYSLYSTASRASFLWYDGPLSYQPGATLEKIDRSGQRVTFKFSLPRVMTLRHLRIYGMTMPRTHHVVCNLSTALSADHFITRKAVQLPLSPVSTSMFLAFNDAPPSSIVCSLVRISFDVSAVLKIGIDRIDVIGEFDTVAMDVSATSALLLDEMEGPGAGLADGHATAQSGASEHSMSSDATRGDDQSNQGLEIKADKTHGRKPASSTGSLTSAMYLHTSKRSALGASRHSGLGEQHDKHSILSQHRQYPMSTHRGTSQSAPLHLSNLSTIADIDSFLMRNPAWNQKQTYSGIRFEDKFEFTAELEQIQTSLFPQVPAILLSDAGSNTASGPHPQQSIKGARPELNEARKSASIDLIARELGTKEPAFRRQLAADHSFDGSSEAKDEESVVALGRLPDIQLSHKVDDDALRVPIEEPVAVPAQKGARATNTSMSSSNVLRKRVSMHMHNVASFGNGSNSSRNASFDQPMSMNNGDLDMSTANTSALGDIHHAHDVSTLSVPANSPINHLANSTNLSIFGEGRSEGSLDSLEMDLDAFYGPDNRRNAPPRGAIDSLGTLRKLGSHLDARIEAPLHHTNSAIMAQLESVDACRQRNPLELSWPYIRLIQGNFTNPHPRALLYPQLSHTTLLPVSQCGSGCMFLLDLASLGQDARVRTVRIRMAHTSREIDAVRTSSSTALSGNAGQASRRHRFQRGGSAHRAADGARDCSKQEEQDNIERRAAESYRTTADEPISGERDQQLEEQGAKGTSSANSSDQSPKKPKFEVTVEVKVGQAEPEVYANTLDLGSCAVTEISLGYTVKAYRLIRFSFYSNSSVSQQIALNNISFELYPSSDDLLAAPAIVTPRPPLLKAAPTPEAPTLLTATSMRPERGTTTQGRGRGRAEGEQQEQQRQRLPSSSRHKKKKKKRIRD